MSNSSSQSTKRKKVIIYGAIVVVILIVAGAFYKIHHQSHQVLKIGITSSFAHQFEVAAEEAKKQGINVEIVEFSDWNTPNLTLEHGDIDVNYFQHQPFLTNAIKEGHLHLKPYAIGNVSNVGLYSKKYDRLDALPAHATIAIPNDPVNQGRALLLLQQGQLIKLNPDAGYLAGLHDITDNPKQFKFVEVEGVQLARALSDVDLAFGYPHYLVVSKAFDPNKALLFDDIKNSNLYAIQFVVNDQFNDDGRLKKFVEIYRTSPVVKAALDHDFGKLYHPAW
ncbi:MetQ/NlpA family ABC transporter substrate-binding protein [Aquirhabdus sp.]|uniref:MetQ/NlpA family ABC transporter substrate-binding protein n=1 Tax=Aquirhabdus sp. TaxID=2824160 RepID=UPI00396CAFD8